MKLGYMLCHGIDMLHKGTSLQYQNFVKLPPMLLKLFDVQLLCSLLASCSSTLELLLPFTDPQPWGAHHTSQYKWSLCAPWQPCPLDPDCSHSHSQWGFSADVSVCSVSSLRRQCMVCYVSTIISTNGTGPFVPSLNSRITPSTQTVTELLVKSASRLIGGSGQYFFSVKNYFTPVLRQYPKEESVLFVPRCKNFIIDTRWIDSQSWHQSYKVSSIFLLIILYLSQTWSGIRKLNSLLILPSGMIHFWVALAQLDSQNQKNQVGPWTEPHSIIVMKALQSKWINEIFFSGCSQE